MDRITEDIFIGHKDDAVNVPLLQAAGIDAVLNVAIDLDICPAHDGLPFTYCKVGMIDGEGNFRSTLLAAVRMLRQLIKWEHTILVHCMAGISRSPTVVSLYLNRYDGVTLSYAFDYVLEHRPVADIHEALIELARSLEKVH